MPAAPAAPATHRLPVAMPQPTASPAIPATTAPVISSRRGGVTRSAPGQWPARSDRRRPRRSRRRPAPSRRPPRDPYDPAEADIGEPGPGEDVRGQRVPAVNDQRLAHRPGDGVQSSPANSAHSVTSAAASASSSASVARADDRQRGHLRGRPDPRALHQVVGNDRGAALDQERRDGQGRCLAEVVRARLEGESEEGDPPIGEIATGQLGRDDRRAVRWSWLIW